MKVKTIFVTGICLLMPFFSSATQLSAPECASDHKVDYLLSKANEYYGQKNYQFTYLCLRHAAAQNDSESMFYIANFYLNGLPGVLQPDVLEGQIWMNAAEFNGSQQAADYNKKQKELIEKLLNG